VGAAAEIDEEVTPRRLRAVVFDLWNTIAKWPHAEWADVRPRVAERLGLSPEEFDERWYGELAQLRETGPIAEVLARFELSPEAVRSRARASCRCRGRPRRLPSSASVGSRPA
jgi:hypothetical protein